MDGAVAGGQLGQAVVHVDDDIGDGGEAPGGAALADGVDALLRRLQNVLPGVGALADHGQQVPRRLGHPALEGVVLENVDVFLDIGGGGGGVHELEEIAPGLVLVIDAVLLQGEQQLAHSLQITKPRLLEQQQLREQRLQRQRQRQFTRDWQSALEALAALLPEHAWLTTISWQQGTLEIKGLTTSITALNALETSLRQDASFHLNQRGATQQDAQGRWQFEYQLTRKVSDEHVL